MNIPDGLLYTKEHEWAKVEGSEAKIGISDYAQNSLGDITFIELPKVGDDVEQFKMLTTIESVKAASDIYVPFSGKIIKVNEEIADSPQLLNESPYENGWIAIIELTDPSQRQNLMSADEYKVYTENLS